MILRIESAGKRRDERERTRGSGQRGADGSRREGAGRGRCYGLLMQLRAHEVQVAEVVEAEGATFGGLYT